MNDTLRWFHVVVSTYGSWVDGDPRGFRTRHHREHVEGDYNRPPPSGLYADRERRSRESLKEPPVVLPPDWRPVIGEAFRERLGGLGVQLLCISVSGQHVHYLAKMPPLRPRLWTGYAKRHAWFIMRARGWAGQLWAKRSKATPVRDRRHQLNAYWYILKHLRQGAWVWTTFPHHLELINRM